MNSRERLKKILNHEEVDHLAPGTINSILKQAGLK